MSYTPNNLDVFTSAYASTVGGLLGFGKTPTNPNEEIYALACETAGAFAQAVDGLWSGTPDWLEIQILQSLCVSEWLGKNVPSSVPPVSAFASAAAGILAILEASEAYFDSEGIEPPAIPGSATIEIALTGDVIGTGPADDVVTQAIQLQSFAGPFNPPENGSWTQATWFVDPSNVSGHASDANSGLTDTTPLLTWRELGRRFGTSRPAIDIDVSITVMSSITTSDPFSLVNLGLGAVTISGSQTVGQASSGVIAGFVAKNQTTGVLASFTALSGMAIGQTVRNDTRGSYSTIYKLADGIATLSQAMNFLDPSGIPSEDNTWANGDEIVSFVPPTAYFQEVGDLAYSELPLFEGGGIVIQDLTLNNPLNPNASITVYPQSFFDRCPILCAVSASTLSYTFAESVVFTGCFIEANIIGYSSSFNSEEIVISPISFFAGICNWCLCPLTFGNDAILGAIGEQRHNLSGGNIINFAPGLYIDAQDCIVYGFFDCAIGPIWGPAGSLLSVIQGTISYDQISPAADTFLFGGTLAVGPAASETAYSLSTTAGVTTIHGGIALTPANLDAPAGSAGFGGTATNLAGAAITNGVQS